MYLYIQNISLFSHDASQKKRTHLFKIAITFERRSIPSAPVYSTSRGTPLTYVLMNFILVAIYVY